MTLLAYDNANLPSESCDLPPSIKDAQSFVVDANKASLSWKSIEFPLNPVVGYEIEYRALENEAFWTSFSGNPIAQQPVDEIITVDIPGLDAGAWYEFRVRPVLDDDCGQQWDATIPKSKLPPLTPFTDPNAFTYLQSYDVAQMTNWNAATYGLYQTVAPLEDGTIITPGASGTGFDITGAAVAITAGTPITIGRGDVLHLPASAGGTVLQTSKPATVTTTVRRISDGFKFGKVESAQKWHLSTDVLLGAYRETRQYYHIYSLPGTAPTIEVYQQGATESADTLITTLTGVGGGIVPFSHSQGSAVYSFRATDAIIVSHVSRDYRFYHNNFGYDQKPINPPGLRVISSSTRNAAIAARFDATNAETFASSSGSIGTTAVGRAVGAAPPGLPNQGVLYSGDSAYFDGDNLPIVGGPGADSDGTKQTLMQDVDTLGTRVRLATDWTEGGYAYLKVASPFNFTLTETDPSGAVVNTYTANGSGPYELRIASPTPQNMFESSQPAQFVAQQNGGGDRDDDEVALWGY